MNEIAIPESSAIDTIRSRIFTIRGVQVILAPDLADMYQVETRIFNQAVKRNLKRFPDNFRFQLTKGELEEVVTNCDNPDRLTMKRRSDQMASRVEHVERVDGRGFVDGNNFDN